MAAVDEFSHVSWVNNQGGALLLDVLVVPRASRTRLMGIHDSRVKIQLVASPVDGQANRALVRFLADILGVARAQIEVVGGASSKRKTVRLRGVHLQKVVMCLSPRR